VHGTTVRSAGPGSLERAFGADRKRSAPPDQIFPREGTTGLARRVNWAMPSSGITILLRDSTRRLACSTTISVTFRWRDAHLSNRGEREERHVRGDTRARPHAACICSWSGRAAVAGRAGRGQGNRTCTRRDPALPMRHLHPQGSLVTSSEPALSRLHRVVRPPAQIWAPA
jgi:hypothetical protein